MRKPLLSLVIMTGAAWSADVDPAAVPSPTLEDLTRRIAALESQQAQRYQPQESELIFFGFADLTWHAVHDDPVEGNANHFALGQFDLFVRHDLGERASFLGEVVLEADENGNTVVDLERAILSYKPIDSLELSAGRYHTHLGWWNTNYHHGEWFQPTIGRPAGLEFEDGGGILPAHLIGLAGEQQVNVAAINMTFVVEIGNGRGPAPDPPQVAVDANNSKAINMAENCHPESFPTLMSGPVCCLTGYPILRAALIFLPMASLMSKSSALMA